MKRTRGCLDADDIWMWMPWNDTFERARWLVSCDCRSRDDSGDASVRLQLIQSGGHRPRRLSNDHRRVRPVFGEAIARERARDEPHGIDSVYCRTKNVVKIGSKPLKRTAQ